MSRLISKKSSSSKNIPRLSYPGFVNSLFENLETLESENWSSDKKSMEICDKIKETSIKETSENETEIKILKKLDEKKSESYNLSLFCDGASRGKPPGASSCGTVLFDRHFLVSKGQIKIEEIQNTEPIWQKGQKIGNATNNIAEWTAVILGLEYILKNFGTEFAQINLQILLDSNLVVQQFNKKWQVKDSNLRVLSNKAQKLKNQLVDLNANISCTHIYRENNFLADRMANLALDE